MKVYCCYTEAHEPLLTEHFIPSLPNDVQLIAIPLDIDGPGDFLSTEFIQCINRKMVLIEESLKSSSEGIIVWADIDIVFLKSFTEEIENLMQTRGDDLLFQKEGFGQWENEVNTGFIAMRCNERVRSFYREVRKQLQAYPEKNEQPVVNELLRNNPCVRFSMLPLTFAARSHGWPPREDIILYHANVTMGEGGVQQKQNQFKELRAVLGIKQRRVCVVSPEVIGPRRNSGIGTHTYHLLKMLGSCPEVDVTLLLTAEIFVDDEEKWIQWFADNLNIRFVHLEKLPHPYPLIGWFNYWFNYRSLQVFNYLHKQNFEIVHFQDLNADGFICHQARETGLGFEKAVFTTMINGPARWAREGMKQFVGDEVYESMLNYMESYPLSRSDMVIAPSNYAFDYISQEAEWDLGKDRMICPYMLDLPESDAGALAQEPAIIFFGRLETRKGIHLFLQALELLHSQNKNELPRKVIFLGSHSETPLGPSAEVIPDFFSNRLPGWKFDIYSTLDQPECMDFLSTQKTSVIVLPSISETLGYVAIECLSLGLNVIGTNSGAFPEVFTDADRLFECHPRAVAEKIIQAFAGRLPPPTTSYSPEKALESWNNLQQKCMEISRLKKKRFSLKISPDPLVSVCLTYFNYGNYIDEQLDSLVAQTYKDFEIIFINDGSTEPKSIDKYSELKQRYSNNPRLRFFEQENRGLSNARNKAAELAKGDLIVFCDADNISRPTMLEVFVRAIQRSEADCVTAYFEKFRINENGEREQLDYYTPVGPCLAAGPFVDPFGDANCIIRKHVFEKIGGFRQVPFTASEDWEFFAELVLKGFKHEVVPKVLFEYREHARSNMRTTSFYDTRMRTLHPYLKRASGWMKDFIVNAMGAWEIKKQHQIQFNQQLYALNQQIEKLKIESEAEINQVNRKNHELVDKLANAERMLEKMKKRADSLQDNLDSLRGNFFKRIFLRK